MHFLCWTFLRRVLLKEHGREQVYVWMSVQINKAGLWLPCHEAVELSFLGSSVSSPRLVGWGNAAIRYFTSTPIFCCLKRYTMTYVTQSLS